MHYQCAYQCTTTPPSSCALSKISIALSVWDEDHPSAPVSASDSVRTSTYYACLPACRCLHVLTQARPMMTCIALVIIIQTAQQLWVPRWGSLRLAPITTHAQKIISKAPPLGNKCSSNDVKSTATSRTWGVGQYIDSHIAITVYVATSSRSQTTFSIPANVFLND